MQNNHMVSTYCLSVSEYILLKKNMLKNNLHEHIHYLFFYLDPTILKSRYDNKYKQFFHHKKMQQF